MARRRKGVGSILGRALSPLLGAFRPVIGAVLLYVLLHLLALVAQVVGLLFQVVLLCGQTVYAIGCAVITLVTSDAFAFWLLVSAQIGLGFLLGFGAGLRAQKPTVRGSLASSLED